MLEGLGKVTPNPKVKALQEKLRAAGYNIVVDGIMGPKTRDALARYNASHGGVDQSKGKGTPGAHGPGLTTTGPTANPTPLPKVGTKWSDFWQGLIVAGAGFAQKKDAEKQAAKLRAQGQDAQVLRAADGTYTVATGGEMTGGGIGAAISENKVPLLIGGGLLLALLFMRKK